MKRIEWRESAIEGVVTRHGTLVGPLMTELTGISRADPVRWRLVRERRHRERSDADAPRAGPRVDTRRMGERLAQEGYRGYFELDFLADTSSGELYLGELNPRVTGASSMTNVTAVAYGDMPLFLFHLLEFMDVDYEIDVEELNEQWAHRSSTSTSGASSSSRTSTRSELITEAPAIGHLADAGRTAGSASCGARPTGTPSRTRGGLLPPHRRPRRVPLPRCRHRHPRHPRPPADRRPRLTERAKLWITGIKKQFWTVPMQAAEPVVTPTRSRSRCCRAPRYG